MPALHFFQSHQPAPAHLMHGFSLMETMVTVGIMAILAALAAPSFQTLIDKWRVQQTVESMKSTLYYARTEAIKRGGGLGIQKNVNSSNCTLAKTAQEWGCGWFVFVDSDGNGKQNGSEEILQTIAFPTNIDVIHKSGSANIKVDRYGKMSGLNAKGFIFSPTSTGISSPATRGICMASGGRIRVIEDVPCSN
jgi:type IV fimbrial biogenesis protein FimT